MCSTNVHQEIRVRGEGMNHYYVNAIPEFTGTHEVHEEDCPHLPGVSDRVYLGFFANCGDALREAKKEYDRVDGCRICSPACHKH